MVTSANFRKGMLGCWALLTTPSAEMPLASSQTAGLQLAADDKDPDAVRSELLFLYIRGVSVVYKETPLLLFLRIRRS